MSFLENPALANSKIKLRQATLGDAKDLWDWRNDPETRANSRTTAPVLWQDHLDWLTRRISDPATTFLVGELGGSSIGTVRFDPLRDGMREISITLAPFARGKGLGAELLGVACRQLEKLEPAVILARVRTTNLRSQVIFENIGFVPV